MTEAPLLEIDALRANVAGNEILTGLNLTIRPGEVHAIMGPNGSGKSTLANTLMGNPRYEVTGGEVRFLGDALDGMAPDERARRGLFLAFQYPVCLLYTSPSPRDGLLSRMPSSA